MSSPEQDADSTAVNERSITRNESMAMLGASVLSAASAFISTVVARRFIPADDVTEFMVFWSLLFGVYGVIGGIASEATRAVGAAFLNRHGREDAGSVKAVSPRGARPAVVALAIGAVVAVLIVGTAPLWSDKFLSSHTGLAVIAVAVATVLYSVQVAMSGAASGMHKWYLVATINGGEATWRFIAVVIVGLIAGSLWGVEAAVASPALLWVILVLCSPHAREAFVARGDVPAKQLTINTLIAMGSAAASAALTTGFPLMMKVTEHVEKGTHPEMVLGALIFAISITRSPIMIPLQAFQGVAISLFLKQSHRPVAAMAKPVGALLGVGLLGGVAAYLLGPWLFILITGPRPEEVAAYTEASQGWVLGLLTFASAVMALLVLSGTAVLAMNLHKTYILGWIVAAVVSLMLVLLPLPLIPRAIISLFVGPLLGFATHMAGLVLDAKKRGISK